MNDRNAVFADRNKQAIANFKDLGLFELRNTVDVASRFAFDRMCSRLPHFPAFWDGFHFLEQHVTFDDTFSFCFSSFRFVVLTRSNHSKLKDRVIPPAILLLAFAEHPAR